MDKTNIKQEEFTNGEKELERKKEDVRNNPSLIKERKYQTHDLFMEAVNSNGLMLEYITEQMPDICETAVRNNPYAIKFAKYQSLRMCEHAVFLVPELIQYAKFQTSDMCRKAIDNDIHLLKNIKEPELIIWVLAALKNKSCLKWIKDKNTKKRVNTLIKSFEVAGIGELYFLEQCFKDMDFEQLKVFNDLLKENNANIKINEDKKEKIKELAEYYLDGMTPSLGSSIIDEITL